jgi:hypothetical protein
MAATFSIPLKSVIFGYSRNLAADTERARFGGVIGVVTGSGAPMGRSFVTDGDGVGRGITRISRTCRTRGSTDLRW